MIKIIMLIAFGIVSGVLYRLGGIGKPFNTKYRDFGVPLITFCAVLLITREVSVQLVLSTVLLFASLTTYWKFISRLIGQSTDNVHWYNWLFTGLGYGLALVPMHFAGIPIMILLVRAALLAILTMQWSELIDDVDWEEFGRGFLIIITLGIL